MCGIALPLSAVSLRVSAFPDLEKMPESLRGDVMERGELGIQSEGKLSLKESESSEASRPSLSA